MKRLILAALTALAAAGCASQEGEGAAVVVRHDSQRLGAGDDLGWRLRAHDRAITSATAEERDLATHE